jgi:hypothetical protein
MTDKSQYPRLRQLWLRRAWKAKWRTLGGAIFGLSLGAVFTSGLPGNGGIVYVLAGICFGIYCAVRLGFIIVGLINFKSLWQTQLEESVVDPDIRFHLERVEQELGERTRIFRDVAFTENYFITFVKVSAVAPTTAIRSIHFENNVEMKRPSSLSTFQELYCEAYDLGRVTLSYQYHEMAEIIGEILFHNPHVWRDENVREEFYVIESEPTIHT